MNKNSESIWNKYGVLIWLALLPLAWSLIRRLFSVPEMIMPPLEKIFEELYLGLIHGGLAGQTLFSLAIVAGGLAAGTLFAFGLAMFGNSHPIPGSLVQALSAVFHPLPGITLLPLIILWAGTGIPAVMFIILHSVIWPMAVNLTAGMKSVPRDWPLFARNLGMGPAGIFFRVSLPAIFSYFLSGLKIGWSRAWRALISAEMIFGAVSGDGGLGWYLFNQRMFMNSAGIYAGIIIIMLIGIVVEKIVFEWVEKKSVVRWGMHHG